MKRKILQISIIILLFYSLLYVCSKIAGSFLTSYWSVLVIIISVTFITYILIPCFSFALGAVCTIKKYGAFSLIVLGLVNLVSCGIFLFSTVNMNTNTSWPWVIKYLSFMFVLSIASYFIIYSIKKFIKRGETETDS